MPPINNLIIHGLFKDQGETEPRPLNSQQCLIIAERHNAFITQLNTSFYTKHYSLADIRPENNAFNASLSNFYINPSINFYEMTLNMMNHLHDFLREHRNARGGYFVFCDYHILNRNYLSIFLIRNSQGLAVDENGNNIDVVDTTYLDTDKFAMACRIDIERYINNGTRHVHFTTKRSTDASQYFKNWVGVVVSSDSKLFANNFIHLIESIQDEGIMPLKPGTEEQYTDIDEFRKDLFGFVMDGNCVNIPVISEQFFGDREFLNERVNRENLDIPTEFNVNRTQMRKLYRYDIKAGNISVKFAPGDIGNRIFSNEEETSLIINSPDLVRKFINMQQNQNE